MSLSIEEKIGKNFFKFNYSKYLVQHSNTSPSIDNNTSNNSSNNSYLTISESLNDKQLNSMEENIENLLMDDPTLMTSSFKLKETYPTNDNDLLNSLGDINEKTFEKSINEIFSRRERIIIKSLLNFDRENTEVNINHFTYRTPDYAMNANVKKEKELFGKIEQIMRKYFYTREKETKMNKHPHENKTISNSLAVIVVKDIIVAVINVIREWTENKITEHFANGDDEENADEIFEEIYNEYVNMWTRCSEVEKDFMNYFDCVRSKMKLTFLFSDIFKDLFWDFIFRVKILNTKFLNFFGDNFDIDKQRDVISKIVDVLWSIEYPYKSKLGEYLSISCIINEKIHLANYIIDYKNKMKNKQNTINSSVSLKPSFDFGKNFIDDEGKNLQSIDELYDYIVNDAEKPRSKKKNKKRNKRKKDSYNDPIVDRFKSELCDKVINASTIQKIKPNISTAWLESIISLNQ